MRADRRHALVVCLCRLAASLLRPGFWQTIAMTIGLYSLVSCLGMGILHGLCRFGLSWTDDESMRAQAIDALLGIAVPLLTLISAASLLLVAAVVVQALRRLGAVGRG